MSGVCEDCGNNPCVCDEKEVAVRECSKRLYAYRNDLTNEVKFFTTIEDRYTPYEPWVRKPGYDIIGCALKI